MPDRETLVRILDLARWAPSGDNTQPWRFKIIDDGRVAVHGFDTRDHVIYDFDGHASHIAHGALLETIRIAASGFGCTSAWKLRPGCPDTAPIYDVFVREEANLGADPLLAYIQTRVVQRRPMRTTPLTSMQKQVLTTAPGEGYEVRFFESAADRWAMAKLLWENAYVRLTCPEAFQVHREVIEWGARFSRDRIPEQAVGVDPLTGKLMRWVMKSWGRVDFFNRYLFGTIVPRIQLDLLPALGCAAHLVLHAARPPSDLADYARVGGAIQRLWLTAASVGLHLQPEMTPVIFNWYARAGRSVSVLEGLNRRVGSLAGQIGKLMGPAGSAGLVFICRVGVSDTPISRSTRKDLDELTAQAWQTEKSNSV
ncbi:MAG: nitroreductase family protein [Proteobacteria bacterium]|nr:nitroreductase family protein [Pseudomonadota bacterium]